MRCESGTLCTCERWPSERNVLAEALAWAGRGSHCPVQSLPSPPRAPGSFGEDSDVGITHGPNSAFQQLCSRVKHQDRGKVRNLRTSCTPFCLGLGSYLYCWKSSSIPIWTYLECDVVPKPMETSIVGHYIVRLSFLKNC